jgi:predicted MFS family arabinose efflux permease
MPWTDWQFWVVTVIALVALFVLYRVLVPRKKGKRTNLTVSAKKHDKQCDSDCGCS